MKVAAAQIACSLGDIEANVRKIGDFSTRAKESGVELIVFPEVADTGYSMPIIQECARPWTSGSVPALQRIARDLSIGIICGVSEREGPSIYNSQVFINTTGEILGSYRKTHLFTGNPTGEDKCFLPGNELKSIAINGLRFGLTICYDLRFPEVFRMLAVEHGVNVFVLSSAWPFPRIEHLRVLASARAIENQSYMIVSNRVGTDDGVRTCGASTIIDPYGVVLASASTDQEELVEAEISEETVRAVRSRMAVFAQRRADLYGSNKS